MPITPVEYRNEIEEAEPVEEAPKSVQDMFNGLTHAQKKYLIMRTVGYSAVRSGAFAQVGDEMVGKWKLYDLNFKYLFNHRRGMMDEILAAARPYYVQLLDMKVLVKVGEIIDSLSPEDGNYNKQKQHQLYALMKALELGNTITRPSKASTLIPNGYEAMLFAVRSKVDSGVNPLKQFIETAQETTKLLVANQKD